jgi:PAS domain S-box-containing protein
MQLQTIHEEKISFVLADFVGDIYSILNKAHQDYQDMERGNLFELSQECLNCHNYDSFDDIKESVNTNKSTHSLFRTPEGEIMNRTAATMSVFNEEWVVSISQPYEAIQGQISRNFINNFVAVALLLFGMIFGILFVYRERNKRFLEIQYSSLINNINVGIFRAKTNGDVIDMNQAMLSLLGLEDGTKFKNKSIEGFLRYKTDWQGIVNSFSKTTTSKEGNYWVKRREHGDFLALFLLRAVKDNKGEISYIEGVLQDITDMKRAEEERIRVTRLESIELLAGGIAHDFNNQLTAIVGNISLSRLTNDAKKRNELLLNAEKASFRAQGLTQQLLTFSRGGSPVRAPDSIEPIIRECADFVLRGSNCKVEYNFSPDLKLTDIDAEQIRQVVQNLVINANQAMPGGGIISIIAANETVSNLSSLTPGEYVKITFQDNGSGIPSEIVDRIFDPYFTTKETGSGLGLAVSYSVVKKHGGVLFVNSTPGTGTIFTIYLPTAESNKSSRRDEEAGEILYGTGNVLVIDDDKSVGETLVSILEELGYEPHYVTNGDEAIRLLKEKILSFDIVVTDLTLPGGMGGVEIKDHIRQINPDMKIIVASGYSNDPVLSKHKEYGFDGVIRKPFKITTVAEVLHREIQK